MSFVAEFEYTDENDNPLIELDEKDYVFPLSHEAQTVLRDRIIFGNNQYGSVDFTDFFTVSDEISTQLQTLPLNSEIDIVARVRYADGTESADKIVGSLQIQSESNVKINQTAVITSVDRDITEIAFFGLYKNKSQVRYGIEFPVPDIYNQHIPSANTAADDETSQDLPLNPHVFLGLKYVYRWAIAGGGIAQIRDYIRDEVWYPDEPDNMKQFGGAFFVNQDTIEEDAYPEYLSLQPIALGPKQTYKLKFRTVDTTGNMFGIYELAIADGIVYAPSVTTLYTVISNLLTNNALSSKIGDEQFQTDEQPIIDVLDQTNDYDAKYVKPTGSFEGVIPVGRNRIYLLFETDSIYGDLTNHEMRAQGATGGSTITRKVDFELFNIEYVEDDYPDTESFDINEPPELEYLVYRYSYEDVTRQIIPDISLDEQTMPLMGVIENEIQELTLEVTGLKKTRLGSLEYWKQQKSNFLSAYRPVENFAEKQHFRNQIIWANPLNVGANVAINRTFLPESAINSSAEYGSILKLIGKQNVLYVFFEFGVGVFSVGEVLTSQPSGQVAVSSENFLTGFRWLVKDLSGIIYKSSIKEYGGMIYFSNGRDVFRIGDSLENLTNGAIELVPGDFGLFSGFNPLHDEYIISDSQQSFSMHISSGQWSGPHTYINQFSDYIGEDFYAINDEDFLVQHDQGNEFDDTPYDTIIKGVALDAEDSLLSKTWWKMWLDVSFDEDDTADLDFNYEKKQASGSSVTKDVRNLRQEQELYKIGINPSNQNGIRIFWKFTTNIPNFILRGISAIFTPRNTKL